jgi:hypothetical protein
MNPDALEEVIRESGEAWLIDWHRPREEAIPYLRRTLADLDSLARSRLGASAPVFTEDALVAEFGRNPHRVKAFLQALGARQSVGFLLLTWRVLQGLVIQDVQVRYERTDGFHARVVLTTPEGNREEYETDNLSDARFFRHIGIVQVNGRDVFDGFYALRSSQ